jgi:hypothetical protein
MCAELRHIRTLWRELAGILLIKVRRCGARANRASQSRAQALITSISLFSAVDDQSDRLDDEIGLMDLDIVIAAGGEGVRSIGLEFDQILGAVGPDTFQVRKCKTRCVGWTCKRLGLVSTTSGIGRSSGGAFSIWATLASMSICSNSGLFINWGKGLLSSCRYAGHCDPNSAGSSAGKASIKTSR